MKGMGATDRCVAAWGGQAVASQLCAAGGDRAPTVRATLFPEGQQHNKQPQPASARPWLPAIALALRAAPTPGCLNAK